MRVQFSVNDSEWERLTQFAAAKGYPDVPSYCRDVSLNERTYAEMWKEITEKISKKAPGDKFALRDLIDLPPANLGVRLWNNQKALGIRVIPKKDSLNTNVFEKL